MLTTEKQTSKEIYYILIFEVANKPSPISILMNCCGATILTGKKLNMLHIITIHTCFHFHTKS